MFDQIAEYCGLAKWPSHGPRGPWTLTCLPAGLFVLHLHGVIPAAHPAATMSHSAPSSGALQLAACSDSIRCLLNMVPQTMVIGFDVRHTWGLNPGFATSMPT